MKNIKKRAFKKSGFTLAEVLIVIVVIGIVAMAIIGVIYVNSQKAQFTTGLQKAASNFSNIVNYAQADSGTMDTWNFSMETEAFARNYILPYLNIARNCGTENNECFADSYTQKNGSEDTSIDDTYYKIMLTDGVSIAFKGAGEGGCTNTNPSICADFIVDVNGKNAPNRWGRDVFAFQIYGSLNSIVPAETFSSYDQNTGKWTFNETQTINNYCATTGKSCAAKIANEGWEMNY